jgi:hypothetical protein
MANLLPCPNSLENKCPKSDPRIVKQTESFCTFYCATCGTAYVETFPRYDDRAKSENYQKRLAEIERTQKQRDSRPIYFT